MWPAEGTAGRCVSYLAGEEHRFGGCILGSTPGSIAADWMGNPEPVANFSGL